MTTTWIKWSPRGRDFITNPRTKTAHAVINAGPNATGAVRNGSFPLACGRWAPDGWDAIIEVEPFPRRRCKRCEAAVARAAREEESA